MIPQIETDIPSNRKQVIDYRSMVIMPHAFFATFNVFAEMTIPRKQFLLGRIKSSLLKNKETYRGTINSELSQNVSIS